MVISNSSGNQERQDQRFCVIYCNLKQVIVKDSYPIPWINESLDSLSGAKLFSTLGLRSGYCWVDSDSDAKEKSEFVDSKRITLSVDSDTLRNCVTLHQLLSGGRDPATTHSLSAFEKIKIKVEAKEVLSITTQSVVIGSRCHQSRNKYRTGKVEVIRETASFKMFERSTEFPRIDFIL